MGFSIAIDVGAGRGTKIALFHRPHEFLTDATFPTSLYGEDFSTFCAHLVKAVDEHIAQSTVRDQELLSIGIACAGILSSDGAFHLVHNISFLNGHNLKVFLQDYYGVPTAIENDADAGGIAEWSVLQTELIYWVFGGGWGGSWISKAGEIKFPSYDWSGNDADLHHTNEPGYSIPVTKGTLRTLFTEVGGSYNGFEDIVSSEPDFKPAMLIGPCGDGDAIRAEIILSGPGRLRIFKALVGTDDSYRRYLNEEEAARISDPSQAGRYLDKLSSVRFEAAVNTDRLFGKILAHATRTLLDQAKKDGMPANLPICLGGKPSYALPYFGPSAQRALARLGILNYLRPSIVDERGSNANLAGASVLASRIIGH